MLEAEASNLCQRIHHGTSSYEDIVQSWSLAVPLVTTSGQRLDALPPGFGDDFIHSQEQVLKLATPGSAPLVDYFPILKYLPEFMATWKAEARRVRKLMSEDAMRFFSAGKEQFVKMKEDSASVRVEGLIARLLREQDTPGLVKAERRFTDLELGYIGQAAVGAAVDTTSAVFKSLMCCFAAFPNVLKKPQEEVDLVAGNKPPTGDMLGKLVYLEACISEVIQACRFPRAFSTDKTRSFAGVLSRRAHFPIHCLRTIGTAITSSPREPPLSPTRGPSTGTSTSTSDQTNTCPSVL